MTLVRVLLADDSDEMRDILAEILGRTVGLEVVASVGDGESALRRARELTPDVAIVDVRMPGGGPQLVREMVEAVPGIRVIGLSSMPGATVAARMTRAGAARYVLKGDPDVDLAAVVRDVVSSDDGERPVLRPEG